MPRYFFNVQKDSRATDTVGADLADIQAAQIEATSVMGQEMKDHPADIWNDEEWNIKVTDERGLILFTLYSSAIQSSAMPR